MIENSEKVISELQRDIDNYNTKIKTVKGMLRSLSIHTDMTEYLQDEIQRIIKKINY